VQPMKRLNSKIILILCASVVCCTAAFAAVPVVRLDGDRLTLDVKDQPLSTVLGMLSYEGIRIRIDPRINPQITATFNNRHIGAAMAGILRSVDYALIWRKDKAAAPDEEPRLWEIRIFYKGQEGRIRPLKKNKNLTVVRDADSGHHVKDILLLQLTPAMTETALAALLDRLGATIIDAFPPLGIVQLRLPHGSNVPEIAESLANFSRDPQRRTGLCPCVEGRHSRKAGSISSITAAIAFTVHRRNADSDTGQRSACGICRQPLCQSDI
jgi:hypothetical protein